MKLKLIWDSFTAFNSNAVNHLAYALSTNWWIILMIAAAIVSIVIGVKEQQAVVVHEEQNIL